MDYWVLNMYTLHLTPQQLQIIGSALGELPYKVVAALVEEMNRQIKDQEDKANVGVPEQTN